MEQFEFWQLLAGLGLFLYGMIQIEQALKGFSSDAFTAFLQNQTKSPLRGVLGGMIVTAFLQSSTIVGLMVLAFVGAGILQLRNALGIIFGANIGTTMTAWLVMMIGFKLDLDNLALPLLAIGTLTIFFTRATSRLHLWGILAFGFGLLIFGLGYMKDSVEALAGMNISSSVDYPLFYYLLIGLVITAIIQSSSASTMIALSALHGHIIDLPAAAAFIIGANIGTTPTMIIGAINGGADKKRVALAHVLFNVVTAVPVFLLIHPILQLLHWLLASRDALYLLSLFHTFFNVAGVLIFLPFTGHLAKLLERLFIQPDKRACVFVSNIPESVSKDVMEAVMVSVRKETRRLLFKVLLLEARTFKIAENLIVTPQEKTAFRIQDTEHRFTYEECYSELKEIEGELMTFIYSVQNSTSYPEESEHLSAVHHGIHMMVFAAKTIKDIRHDLVDIRHNKTVPGIFSHEQLQKTVKDFARQLIALLDIENSDAYREKLAELEQLVQKNYAERKNGLIITARNSSMSDINLSTLLHINKAILFADKSLLEALANKP